jgi:hypothetical protein
LLQMLQEIRSRNASLEWNVSYRNKWRKVLVDVRGIEPLTPCLQSRCSPS